MPKDRYFTEDSLSENKYSSLSGEEFRHLKVMRKNPGDEIELLNGRGFLATATIDAFQKDSAVLHLTKVDFFERTYRTILWQALPKLHRLEWIAEKGTELGMSEIRLFASEKTQTDFKENKIPRLRAKMISALKQSGGLHLPEIRQISSVSEWEPFTEPAFFGDPNPKAPLFRHELTVGHSLLHLCVGPESGFSSKEVSRLTELGARGVLLHPHTLRTETAALTFLALAGYHRMVHESIGHGSD